jgi:hypothetical protein
VCHPATRAKPLNSHRPGDYSGRMLRFIAAALLLAGQDAPGLGIAPEATFRTRQHTEALITDRAIGVPETEGRTRVHAIIDADLAWKLGRVGDCEVTPHSYRIEFKDKKQSLELKDGKFTAVMENQVEVPGITKPFQVALAESGKIGKIALNDAASPVLAKFLFDGLPSDSSALLGWFGPLPAKIVAGQEWTTTRKVLVAREDFIEITATCIWMKEDKVIKGKFRAGGRTWPKDAVEESDGAVALDAKGRVTSVKVAWSAKTKAGAVIASFKSQTDFSE